MSSHQRKSPDTATNSAEASQKKVHAKYTTWLIREMLATLTIGALLSVVMWSCILGMSGNMGPGKGLVLVPIAENDHAK
jgi:hypothetical protein